MARPSAYLAPSQPWRTCTRGWCDSADHESCSIINAQLPSLYMTKHKWGFVLSPNAQYVCSYAVDGGTQDQEMAGCATDDVAWCTAEVYWNCPWRPSQLKDMLQTQKDHHSHEYNEVIVSSHYWNAALPGLIEAIFFLSGAPNCPDCTWTNEEFKARQTHEEFLRHYKRESEEVPLLKLVYGVAADRPFELA